MRLQQLEFSNPNAIQRAIPLADFQMFLNPFHLILSIDNDDMLGTHGQSEEAAQGRRPLSQDSVHFLISLRP